MESCGAVLKQEQAATVGSGEEIQGISIQFAAVAIFFHSKNSFYLQVFLCELWFTVNIRRAQGFL